MSLGAEMLYDDNDFHCYVRTEGDHRTPMFFGIGGLLCAWEYARNILAHGHRAMVVVLGRGCR